MAMLAAFASPHGFSTILHMAWDSEDPIRQWFRASMMSERWCKMRPRLAFTTPCSNAVVAGELVPLYYHSKL